MRLPSPLRVLTLTALASAAVAEPVLAHGTHRAPRPEVLRLPDGFQPEGIARLDRDEVVVGSIPTGALYRLDVRTGQGSLLAPGAAGRAAIGVEVAGGRILVAGGPTGKVRVQSARDGSVLREEQAGTPGATFVNDVAVARDGVAWFTDSRAARIYGLPLDGGPLRTVALTGAFTLGEGNNLNGIVATKAGHLLAVQTNAGKLLRIDPATGATEEVDLGGATLENGDGLLLEHGLLSVVQNRSNRIAQLWMSRDGRSARIVRTLTDPDFDVPTTIARVAGALYAVNARFGTTATPQTPYTVVRVDGSHGHR